MMNQEGLKSELERSTLLTESLHRSLLGLGITKRVRMSVQDQLATLPRQQVVSINKSIEFMSDCILKAQRIGIDPWDSVSFMKYGLRLQGYSCGEDFWNTVGNEDLIEAYTTDHMQIFRNLRFMQICGYSLVEILSYDWPTLFERSQVITLQMIDFMSTCVENTELLKMTVPVHYMKERMAQTRQVVKVDFRYVAPLYSGPGKPTGYVISSKADLIDEEPVRHELRFL